MKYKCKLCKEVFEVEIGEAPVCPRCGATAENLEPMTKTAGNKYAGTQTEKNLHAAFDGESGARNKYTYFASVAKKEGYLQYYSLYDFIKENYSE